MKLSGDFEVAPAASELATAALSTCRGSDLHTGSDMVGASGAAGAGTRRGGPERRALISLSEAG